MTPRPRRLVQGRRSSFLARSAVLAACGALAAACGSTAAPVTHPGGDPGSHGIAPASAGTGSATSAARVSLRVTYTRSFHAPSRHWTLRCEPAGGSYPDPAAACARLLAVQNVFGPQPARVMCPMILADAGSYFVSGTFLGRPVHETIVDGGCDLARWADLHKVFS
jgi:hypothetical protein